MKLLCLSNGHGEDVIAVQILKQLRHYTHNIQIQALPLVGKGKAYNQLEIPLIAPVEKMPSGGFIYQDIKQLGRDIQGGLLGLTLAQYKAIREWDQHNQGLILAVGDIVPLLFAWLTGASYAFVGSAKSDYYLQDETGWLSKTSWFERLNGSVYFPWERWLMSRPKCLAVFPRDSLTAKMLQKWSIPVFDLGNPMMDGIVADQPQFTPQGLTILLLPGSRLPEAIHNWETIISAVTSIIDQLIETKLTFLAAIAPSVNPEPLKEYLLTQGFHPITHNQACCFSKNQANLIISQNAYGEFLMAADVAIAMAGTATEQFVGLGKPVIIIPGKGPQFTYRFAEAQTRLLGCSVILVSQPEVVALEIQSLMDNPERLAAIAINGQIRMGTPGAAARIAETLIKLNKDL